jgi:hypothetical protein
MTLGIEAYGVFTPPIEGDLAFDAVLSSEAVGTYYPLFTGTMDSSFDATLSLDEDSEVFQLESSYDFTLSSVANDGCSDCGDVNTSFTVVFDSGSGTWLSTPFSWGCATGDAHWRMRFADHGFGMHLDLELVDTAENLFVWYIVDPATITDPTDFVTGLNGYLSRQHMHMGFHGISDRNTVTAFKN